jgi:hypothetical protein
VAVFVGIFGILGLTINYISLTVVGFTWPTMISGPTAFLMTLPLVARISRTIAKFLPRDETNSIHVSALVGLTGTIISGTASKDGQAFATVYDPYLTQHTVRVFSMDGPIPTYSKVTLVNYSDQGHFLVTKL